jgi:hypothetical protein
LRAPLYALALRICGGRGAGLAVLRMIERIGALIGLAICAILLDDIGAESTVRILGMVVLSGIGLYGIAEITGRVRRA